METATRLVTPILVRSGILVEGRVRREYDWEFLVTLISTVSVCYRGEAGVGATSTSKKKFHRGCQKVTLFVWRTHVSVRLRRDGPSDSEGWFDWL